MSMESSLNLEQVCSADALLSLNNINTVPNVYEPVNVTNQPPPPHAANSLVPVCTSALHCICSNLFHFTTMKINCHDVCLQVLRLFFAVTFQITAQCGKNANSHLSERGLVCPNILSPHFPSYIPLFGNESFPLIPFVLSTQTTIGQIPLFDL